MLNILYHPKLMHLVKILETPYIENHPPYKQEIKMILEKKWNANLIEDVINNR